MRTLYVLEKSAAKMSVNKKGLEMSFNWLFAIIVGAVIIFLAIYGATKLIKQGRGYTDTVTAKQLTIIFEPLETGLASAKADKTDLRSETRIYNDCRDSGSFGKQYFSTSTSSGMGKKWEAPGEEIPVTSKYIFSNSTEQGKSVYFFVKPFELPWKIAEVIFLTTNKYCFVNAPEDIEDEMHGLGIYRLNFTDNREACPKGSKMVCFSGAFGCDINVHGDLESGFVSKQESNLYYTGSLIYPAIFSSPEVYECNIKRLMLRISSLCSIYQDKIRIMQKRGIESVLDSHLMQLSSLAKNLKSSQGLGTIKEKADEIEKINMAENLYES